MSVEEKEQRADLTSLRKRQLDMHKLVMATFKSLSTKIEATTFWHLCEHHMR